MKVYNRLKDKQSTYQLNFVELIPSEGENGMDAYLNNDPCVETSKSQMAAAKLKLNTLSGMIETIDVT